MRLVAGFTDLWEIPAAECGLVDGEIYHYWFEVTVPRRRPGHPRRVRITDPTATMVDWRVLAPAERPSASMAYPASVVRAEGGRLVPRTREP